MIVLSILVILFEIFFILSRSWYMKDSYRNMAGIKVLVAALFLVEAYAKSGGHHDMPTYFRRKNLDGSLVDRANEREFNAPLHCSLEEVKNSNSTITVLPGSEIKNGQKVTVHWEVNIPVSYKDFVGIYCPKDGGVAKALDYFNVAVSSTWSSGRGSYAVHVYNLRVECEFRYYAKHGESCTVAARSAPLFFHGGHSAPLQAHIALANHFSQMRVMWTSGTSKCVSLS